MAEVISVERGTTRTFQQRVNPWPASNQDVTWAVWQRAWDDVAGAFRPNPYPAAVPSGFIVHGNYLYELSPATRATISSAGVLSVLAAHPFEVPLLVRVRTTQLHPPVGGSHLYGVRPVTVTRPAPASVEISSLPLTFSASDMAEEITIERGGTGNSRAFQARVLPLAANQAIEEWEVWQRAVDSDGDFITHTGPGAPPAGFVAHGTYLYELSPATRATITNIDPGDPSVIPGVLTVTAAHPLNIPLMVRVATVDSNPLTPFNVLNRRFGQRSVTVVGAVPTGVQVTSAPVAFGDYTTDINVQRGGATRTFTARVNPHPAANQAVENWTVWQRAVDSYGDFISDPYPVAPPAGMIAHGGYLYEPSPATRATITNIVASDPSVIPGVLTVLAAHPLDIPLLVRTRSVDTNPLNPVPPAVGVHMYGARSVNVTAPDVDGVTIINHPEDCRECEYVYVSGTGYVWTPCADYPNCDVDSHYPMQRGDYFDFIAEVSPFPETDQRVIWTIAPDYPASLTIYGGSYILDSSGNQIPIYYQGVPTGYYERTQATVINANGRLIVGAGQAEGQIRVTATSVADPDYYDYVIVTIVAPSDIEFEVELFTRVLNASGVFVYAGIPHILRPMLWAYDDYVDDVEIENIGEEIVTGTPGAYHPNPFKVVSPVYAVLMASAGSHDWDSQTPPEVEPAPMGWSFLTGASGVEVPLFRAWNPYHLLDPSDPGWSAVRFVDVHEHVVDEDDEGELVEIELALNPATEIMVRVVHRFYDNNPVTPTVQMVPLGEATLYANLPGSLLTDGDGDTTIIGSQLASNDSGGRINPPRPLSQTDNELVLSEFILTGMVLGEKLAPYALGFRLVDEGGVPIVDGYRVIDFAMLLEAYQNDFVITLYMETDWIISVTMPFEANWAVVPGDRLEDDGTVWGFGRIGSQRHTIRNTGTNHVRVGLVAFDEWDATNTSVAIQEHITALNLIVHEHDHPLFPWTPWWVTDWGRLNSPPHHAPSAPVETVPLIISGTYELGVNNAGARHPVRLGTLTPGGTDGNTLHYRFSGDFGYAGASTPVLDLVGQNTAHRMTFRFVALSHPPGYLFDCVNCEYYQTVHGAAHCPDYPNCFGLAIPWMEDLIVMDSIMDLALDSEPASAPGGSASSGTAPGMHLAETAPAVANNGVEVPEALAGVGLSPATLAALSEAIQNEQPPEVSARIEERSAGEHLAEVASRFRELPPRS